MKSFLFSFFHNETNDRSNVDSFHIPKDKNLWPKSWTTIYYKTYSLFKPVILEKESGEFFQNFLTKRSSLLGRVSGEVISLKKLSYILRCGYGFINTYEERRTVPSAGSRYPLEIYVCVFRNSEGLIPGVYHYNVKNHSLEMIIKKTFSPSEIRSYSSFEWLDSKSVMICITGIFSRIVEKYGSRGYRYALLEAGHVGQNLLLAGVEVNFQGIPIGGMNEVSVEKILGLESSEEKILYTLFF